MGSQLLECCFRFVFYCHSHSSNCFP
ncbi:hypothetical protein ISN45_At01g069690 [Arabidopsis thaliana x Arabidopsis arenosa]|uniref:Uncharacterized protein n=2 Tax=Arabidopsis TaxID=3701 RepID=A0A8T2C0G9_ARASU|nr:hypothetical protein ISN45_Aa02g027270 [Arabidopsis thaliana x Arabidopsis arenosa]KAG7590644.1 hypothetical protein ISN44_As07g027800 [Arabidopsis suecica]KAG7652205.1 hypothetical protein ISN45_At01g069690 [Arabidopsis thaliana x Arabidopsis arenosa]KAG7660065.1 hypothetical protein ISN44_As01g068590 [Arabidopsis suecica]